MGNVGRNLGCAGLQQRFGRIDQRAARIGDVVDEDAGVAGDVADDVHHFRDAGLRTALVDDGEIGADALGGRPGAGDAADVGRDDHQIAGLVAGLDVADHHRRAVEIVGRDIEEALDLRGMEVERDDAVDAGLGDQIGDQLGRDRGS